MIKGAIHIHSTYSDGEFSLRRVKEIFAAAGCDFVCVTDHAEAFDAQQLGAYLHECKSLSGGGFYMIPGLEYECKGRMHILGIAATTLIETKDPEVLIRHIRASGGISVIAHPRETAFSTIERFRELPDGIEVWNSKYDGRYAPRPGTFSLLRRLRERESGVHGYYGQDLHWKMQCRDLTTLVRCAQSTDDQILRALKLGEYFGVKGSLELPSTGDLPATLLDRFGVINRRGRLLKSSLIGMKRCLDQLGVSVPVSVKAPLRRLF